MAVTIAVEVGEYVDASQDALEAYAVSWNIVVMPNGDVLKLTMQAEDRSISSMWRRIK